VICFKLPKLTHKAILSIVKVPTPFYISKDQRYQGKRMMAICYAIAITLLYFLFSKFGQFGKIILIKEVLGDDI
jgi:hypothetical protein